MMNYVPQIIDYIEKEYSENVNVKYKWINSVEYKNTMTKNIELIDQNGYKYRVELRNIIRHSNIVKSPLKPFAKTNPYMIHNINLYFTLHNRKLICLDEVNIKNGKIELRYICEKGHDFYMRFDVLLGDHDLKCPYCEKNSKENCIKNILKNNYIHYLFQYTFSDCKDKNVLRFDFAIFEDEEKTQLKCLIEYDGEFHYLPIMGDEKLKYQKNKDKIKNNYCKENNIKLIRIPYWEFKNIENILLKEKIINGK